MAGPLPLAFKCSLAFERCLHAQGPVAVLVHGFAGARGQWQDVAARLCRQGWSVYWVDLPGHGASFPLECEEGYRPACWVEALYQWHQAVVQHPAWWVGHSLGGGLVTMLARRYGLAVVRGGVLVAPYLHRRQWHWWVWASRPWWSFLQWLHRIPHGWWAWVLYGWWWPRAYRCRPDLRHQRIEEYLRMDPRCWHTVDAMREPLRPRPPGAWVLLAGARDEVLRYSSFQELAQAWQVPLLTLPQAHHMVHLTHPEAVVQALLRLSPS